jgi:hypothetical protein
MVQIYAIMNKWFIILMVLTVVWVSLVLRLWNIQFWSYILDTEYEWDINRKTIVSAELVSWYKFDVCTAGNYMSNKVVSITNISTIRLDINNIKDSKQSLHESCTLTWEM